MSFTAAARVYDDEVDDVNDNYTPDGIVEVKLYPSNLVKDRTVSTNETSNWSPNELRRLVRNFRQLDPQDRPYIVVEHSRDSKDRLGRVEDLVYDEKSQWLFARGRIDEGKRQQFERTYVHANGGGVSLCYVMGPDYKGLLEFSFVKKPDFANAELIRYHSSTGPVVEIYCLGAEDVPSRINEVRAKMSQEEPVQDDILPSGGEDNNTNDEVDYSDRYFSMGGNEYVIADESDLEGVRQHLLGKGVQNPKIVRGNIDQITAMPESQRMLFLSALMARENSRQQEARQTEDDAERNSLQQAVLEARDLTLSIVSDVPDFDEATTKQLGRVIMTNEGGKIVAEAAELALSRKTATIAERDATIMDLRNQLEKKERNENALRQRSQLRQHAAQTLKKPMASWSDVWDQLNTKHSESASSSTSNLSTTPSTSSSSSSSSSLHGAFGQGAVIKQHSADGKRAAPSSSKADAHQESLKRHRASAWLGMSLYADPNSQVTVIQHSAEGATSAVVDRKNPPSNAEHALAIYRDIESGRRPIGQTRRRLDMKKSLGAICPAMMTALIYGTNGHIETNGESGNFGFEDKIPEHFPKDALKLMPSMRDPKYSHLHMQAEEISFTSPAGVYSRA